MPDHLNSPVVIVGAGNLGKLLWDCLDGDDRWSVVGFIDDGLAGTLCCDLPVYSSDAYGPEMPRDAFMAIGFPNMRRQMLERVAPLELNWRTFVDRRGIVGRKTILGEGVIVLSFAFIASGVEIGPFTYVSAHGQIGAGSRIGAFCSVMPGALVGSSTIGDGCVLGPKSACLDGVVLGDGARVAPLASARGNVPPGAVVAGPSARIIERE